MYILIKLIVNIIARFELAIFFVLIYNISLIKRGVFIMEEINKKQNKVIDREKFFLTFMTGSFVSCVVLIAACCILDKKTKELEEKTYDLNAKYLIEYNDFVLNNDELLDENEFNKVVYIDGGYDFYTLQDKDGLYTRGIYLYDYLVNNNYDCMKLGQDYYSLESKNIYEYIIDNQLYIFDEDKIKSFNGVSKVYQSKSYEELKDFDIYYNVFENDTIESNGNTYYRAIRKLIKK